MRGMPLFFLLKQKAVKYLRRNGKNFIDMMEYF